MTFDNAIEKPKQRNSLRRHLGKVYFRLKRQFTWLFSKTQYAKIDAKVQFDNSLIKHKSLLLRPLKNVDMYLQHNKITNLKIAISKLNKVVIMPGETFSIWKLVGRPSKSKGYLAGLTLQNGKIAKGVGGGLCQLGNLLYWMVLHTPLTVTERWRHGYDVFPDVNRTIPFACGATLSYNYIDLQFKNNTDKVFQVDLWLDDEYLNGEISCNDNLKLQVEVYETDHLIKHQVWGGYTRHNKIWKRTNNLETNAVTEDLIAENNAILMYNPLITG